MTTLVQARDALVTYIHTNLTSTLPTLKVFWENTTQVDLGTVGDRFLQVGIDFDDAVEGTIDGEVDQVSGMVGFRLYIKAGKGTRDVLQVLDTLNALFRQKNYGAVRTGSPYPGKKETVEGWLLTDYQLPFAYFTA